MKKINASRLAAYGIVIAAAIISIAICTSICFISISIFVKVPMIYNALNRSGGMGLAILIALGMAFMLVPLFVIIKGKILDFIIDKMERSMKRKRA